ncbi:MAG TPA: cytochrome c [Rhizomicrobium sp.]|nr:cytochrome c [Rhizomicrobium sp.]
MIGSAAALAASPETFHFADADDAVLTQRGEQIYLADCANCHGRRLQGQALWQLRDKFEGRRAPAQDASGHSWQHSDEALFHMTKYGRFAEAPAGLKSYMPAFGPTLSDADVIAVIAFIKSRWPIGIRAAQAMLNPDHKGMPKDADKVDWTLPPNCSATFQRWAAESR